MLQVEVVLLHVAGTDMWIGDHNEASSRRHASSAARWVGQADETDTTRIRQGWKGSEGRLQQILQNEIGTKLRKENSVSASHSPLSVAKNIVGEAQSRLKAPLVWEIPALVAQPAGLVSREHCCGDTATRDTKCGLFIDEHCRGLSILIYHRRGVFPPKTEIESQF